MSDGEATSTTSFDPLTITVIHDLLVSVAEEMGEALVGAASSPNIKERRDSSCAIFDFRGDMIAQASHIPIHLGSLASSVQEAMKLPLEPGDMVLLNDPYRGGAHLPDLTLVAPLFLEPAAPLPSRASARDAALPGPVAFVANRAHHADVGGIAPGSLPPATEIYQEGLIIPPVRLVRGGRIDDDCLSLVLANTRTPWERRADLLAQIGANRIGLRRLEEILLRDGLSSFESGVAALMAYSERRVQALVARIPEGAWTAEDFLDDDGQGTAPVVIRTTLQREGDGLLVDFTGSAHETRGNVNAVEAVTRSAVLYVLCALSGEELPVNAGCLRPIRFVLPEKSVVNASHPSAVAAGNVETSQRIVDALFKALAPVFPDRIPAASQGTMNNLGLGGVDPVSGLAFAYYETIAGGMGGGPLGPGLDAVQVHLTNTRNTPIEALENALPVRVTRYQVRRGSGGDGTHRGGDGVIREFTFLVPVTVSVFSDRRLLAPWGLTGGSDGAAGRNTRVMADGRFVDLPGKVLYNAAVGEKLIVETPGGGGHGVSGREPASTTPGARPS